MALIVAVEPDRRQAARVGALAGGLAGTQLVVAETVDRAIAVLAGRVPDLILTSLLLSPKEEARLRELTGSGAPAQTLVIPVLAAPTKGAGGRGGLLTRLRGKKSENGGGCDPAVFAAQIAEYLERLERERETGEEDAIPVRRAPEPPAPGLPSIAAQPAAVLPEPVIESSAESVEPEPDYVARAAQAEPAPDDVPRETEPVQHEADYAADETEPVQREAHHAPDERERVEPGRDDTARQPEQTHQAFEREASHSEAEPTPIVDPSPAAEASTGMGATAVVEPATTIEAASASEPAAVVPSESQPQAAEPSLGVGLIDSADKLDWEDITVDLNVVSDSIELRSETIDLATFVSQLEADSAPAPDVPHAVAIAQPLPARPTWPTLEVPPIEDDQVIRDFVYALEEEPGGGSAPDSDLWMPLPSAHQGAWPSMQGGATAAVHGHRTPAFPEPVEEPPQDEWDFFDPDQCGFGALLTKLQEIGK